jgi:hypothetical protein
MLILLVVVLVIGGLGLASQLGWSVDSRDGADWRPTDGGIRSAGPAARH